MRHLMIALAGIGLFAAAPIADAAPKGCPPGLAKKGTCTPPGLAKKGIVRDVHRYSRGQRIGDYVIIRDVDRYGLKSGHTYARSGDYIYRIDRETREVLDLIGAVSAILN